MTHDGQILLLVLASHGGAMAKADAEAEFHRVMALTPEERDAWWADAYEKARVYAELRGQVNDSTPDKEA